MVSTATDVTVCDPVLGVGAGGVIEGSVSCVDVGRLNWEDVVEGGLFVVELKGPEGPTVTTTVVTVCTLCVTVCTVTALVTVTTTCLRRRELSRA